MTQGLKISDYYQLHFLKSYDVSPDGTQIAYCRTEYVDKKQDKSDDDKSNEVPYEEHTRIWLYNQDNDEHRQLTHGDADTNPSWSPDGKCLIFASKRDDQSQLYLLPMEGGEAKQLTHLENGVSSPVEWFESGKKILFSAGIDKKLPEQDKPYKFTREFYRMDMLGNVERVLHDIYSFDLETEELQQLTEDELHHTQPQLSADNTQALVLTMFDPEKTDGIFPRLSLLNLEGGELTELTNYHITTAVWVDDDTIAFVGGDPDRPIGSKTDLFTIDIKSGELTNLTKSDTYGISGGIQADMPTVEARMPKLAVHEDKIYASVQIGGNIEIRAVDLETHSISTIVSGDRANYLADIVHDDLYFSSTTHENPLDIFAINLETEEEYQLTHLNQEFLDTKTLPKVKHLQFKGQDRTDVEGWILLPSEGEGPYPTLLNIHGGPHSAWGNVFQFENQYLCDAGFAVLMVNHRASTGYGDTFSTAITGDWGNLDYTDLMAGIDYAIDQGYADPDRLGCFGISGGGNLSTWIVGQTNRFKAAIPENPVTNWQSFYGVSDIGRWFAVKEMGGLPWEIPEVYIKSSPITHAPNCTTPTLMIQHDNDLRCPPEQTEQFFAVLRDVGCTVEMLRMPGTPHGGSIVGPLETREKQNREILSWFDTYVR